MKKHYLLLVLLLASSLFFSCSKKSDNAAQPASGTFNVAGAVYSGATNSATFDGGVEVNITDGKGNNMIIYNMPASEGGTFDVFNTFQTGVLQSNTDVYASTNVNIGAQTGGSVSLNGKLTKTGARSFTLTGTFQAELSSSTTATVTASGNY